MIRKKTAASILTAFALLAALPMAANAAGPAGFGEPAGGPQGFTAPAPAPMTVKRLWNEAVDEQIVVLRGRFTKQLTREHFEFDDGSGRTVTAELEDEFDWSHVVKDALMEVTAEVERSKKHPERLKIEVRKAVPLG